MGPRLNSSDISISRHLRLTNGPPSVAAEKATVESALGVLVDLGLPREQQNERSALCLLALLTLTPSDTWADAESQLLGITPMMNWARDHFGKQYAPNTRETFRRQTRTNQTDR